MIADPFSPIMFEGAWVLPLMSFGMIEASMTRGPSSPWTRSWGVHDCHVVTAHGA
jgi:hypothetical protein